MRRDFFYYRRQLSRRALLKGLAFFLCAMTLTVAFIAAAHMRPLLENLATTRVANTVTGIVSQAVYEAIESGMLHYDSLVAYEKDVNGAITAVHSDLAAFNHLQAEILDTVLTRMGEVSTRELSIPIGTLTGSALLAGRGPRIAVRMESLGTSEAHFRNDFFCFLQSCQSDFRRCFHFFMHIHFNVIFRQNVNKIDRFRNFVQHVDARLDTL